ncbi:MAG TPA: hypothetical protein VGB30_05475 [bacterium]
MLIFSTRSLRNREIGDQVVITFTRDGNDMRPAVVTIGEKLTRFSGRRIYAYAEGPYAQQATFYASDTTY